MHAFCKIFCKNDCMGFELKALKAINNLEIIDNSLEIIQQFVF